MDTVDTLLTTGSFKTSRSRSPKPPEYDLPVRRRPDYRSGYRPTANTGVRIVRPPPPTVEDEASALAKEHGSSIDSGSHDEEPKFRGEVDQTPLILPVLENNPERRFVIVTGSEAGDEGNNSQSESAKTKYDANTGRKKVPATSSDEDGKERKRRPDLTKRKSHHDLPRLDTHTEDHQAASEASIRRSNSRRNRERPQVSQEPRDYHSERNGGGPRPYDEDGYLSPEPVIRQTAGGREREYWDAGLAAAAGVGVGLARRRSARGGPRQGESDEKRSGSTQSAGPVPHRRSASNVERPNPALNPLIAEFKYSDPDHALAFMMQDDDDMPPQRSRRGQRSSNSPPYPPYEQQDRRHSRSPSFPSRGQSLREKRQYYGDDSFRSQHSDRAERYERRQQRPPLERDSSTLLSPDQPWPPTGRNRSTSNAGSPLPSPRASQGAQFPDGDFAYPPSPRSPRSATFPPTERESRRAVDRPVSPSPPAGTSPPRRNLGAEEGDRRTRSRANSRAATLGGPASVAALPIPIPTSRSDLTDRRPSPGPPPSLPKHESLDSSSFGSPQKHWQPPPFDPSKQSALLDKPITSFRRYSEDVQRGILPQLPDCSWKFPGGRRASDGQFLTLPRADFDVCTDCHSAVFANTDLGRMFVPAVNRSDRAITCDFGSSPWYRIAYLMTLKYHLPDLRLLQGIASVAARQQPCAGEKPANRIWYSMMDPQRGKPIRTFNACSSCAKMVEVLLPNLAGVFVPLTSASEPTRGICELHFAPERKRFTDYFDLLERASDRALSRRTAPDVADLAKRIKELSELDECPRNRPVSNKKWHIMQNLPEFTVCDECFEQVVWPYLRDKEASDIPRDFYNKRQVLPIASCMLYSDRMRDIFKRACRKDDMGYLEGKVRDKLRMEREIKTRMAELERAREDDLEEDPWLERELAGLAGRLREIE
ncbi:hypothetical protein V8F20_000879 [Naviculisporaceae sp. PSN 640]